MPASRDFERALEIGRPPNVVRLFPNSRALIVSGKAIDRAVIAKGQAMTIAANARTYAVTRGVLLAAQRADAAIILEIARTEGGADAWCAIGFWNLARLVDALCNELGISVPVAIHVDHYFIKNERDLEVARVEIPSLFEAGNTSISIDASYLPDDENLLAVLALSRFAPTWAGLETEVGEIKGDAGLSTPEEALFLIRGLNAHGVFPDWIALNNGSTHGIEASGKGIQLELTAEIHDALAPFAISGAQHGTSGNSSERLRRIARETRTTKANVATALQMISWGVQVNDDGNPELGADGELCKRPGEGMAEELWVELVARAREAGLAPNDYKKLSRDLENRLLGQAAEVQNRMVEGVERFAYHLLTEVFNAAGTAPLAIEQLLRAGSYDLGPKIGRIEDPAEWTEAEIRRKAALIGAESRSSGLSRRSV